MAKAPSSLDIGGQYIEKTVVELWDNLGKDNLWKRILKNVSATTILVSICLISGSATAIGRASYLGAIATVFGHPGRRFGQMAEALILTVSGTVIGVAWSTLALYLGSLVHDRHPPVAYAIRAIFLGIAVILHGYLRSKTPRLFILVLLMIICATVTLTSTAKAVTTVGVTQILYPILIAVGVVTLVNICLFPEFSSSFLGQMTIETLNDTTKALEEAGNYFIATDSPGKANEEVNEIVPQGTLPAKSDRGSKHDSSSNTGEQHPKRSLARDRRKLRATFWKRKTHVDDLEASTLEGGPIVTMKHLTDTKAKIRKKLADCQSTQQECNFELAVAVLPPRDMKPISILAMRKLAANTIAIIGACESRFALLGEEKPGLYAKPEIEKLAGNGQHGTIDEQETSAHPNNVSILGFFDHDGRQIKDEMVNTGEAELSAIKPKREIEFGDVRLLRYLTASISNPCKVCLLSIRRTVEVISACLAYVYDVPKLPQGTRPPNGITLEELDVHLEGIRSALIQVDVDCASALEGANTLEEIRRPEPDIMPREEIFLVSSFMLNVRQAGTNIEGMLKHARDLVESRHQRRDKRRIYAPRIKWSKWLYTGGEEDEALPTAGRKENRKGASDDHLDDEVDTDSINSKKTPLSAQQADDVEKIGAGKTNKAKQQMKHDVKRIAITDKPATHQETTTMLLRLRSRAADVVEWTQDSDDLLYAMKLAVAVFLVLWPAFVASWNTWYSLNRGLWAALQLILVTEVSIGTSVMTFIIRGIGTTLGCLWGWAAWEARSGNRVVCAVMICLGCFSFAYIQLGTKYPKAGMVSIISMCVVALATELETVPGTATEVFLKRWIAFTIGGCVALLVELTLLPVKARTRLVESIASALHQINEMEKCIASGIEEGANIDHVAFSNVQKFENASGEANGALDAAETFLPFCSTEPRLKGSFEGLALIYTEMLFVMHQIIDRMDNMLQLRTAYGSGPLEEFNAVIYPYRRNVAGSITLTIFAIRGALTTNLPLPQFLPSARLAHLRMINRVREVVLESVSKQRDSQEIAAKLARQQAVRRKYLSWNASSAAQAEIIEFLEELIDLTKLVVGANEFRSGLLLRPTYQDYANNKADDKKADENEDVAEARDDLRIAEQDPSHFVRRRRRGTTVSSVASDDEVPASLRRIQSRKQEAGIKREMTNEKLL